MFRSSAGRRKEFVPPIAYIGGVSLNRAVKKFLLKELSLAGEDLFVPEHNLTMGAIGAALTADKPVDLAAAISTLDKALAKPLEYHAAERLRLEKSVLMPREEEDGLPKEVELAALGVDIGSVSTKAALITKVDGRWRLLGSHYRRTDGDPLAAVRDTIVRIYQQVEEGGCRIKKVVAATTGSGRYLTGDYLGADIIRNEITTQAAGALTFADDIDSILEIGGQDSKYVRLSEGIITDFEMNKACAAGTGAFLEKQASNLGINIEEYGDYALRAQSPPELDWTCTVFSESAMITYQQNNVPIEDLCAATCLASAKNYLHKNVGHRDIGKKIVFQGAVAFNKGMVAAFETILGKPIVVPPYPHLTGAIGAARLAYESAPKKSRFRGFQAVTQGQYTVSSFECKACPNHCDVNTFQTSGGEKYYYNDRCERYSGKNKVIVGESLPDLFEEHEQMLFDAYRKPAPPGAKRVGIPRGLLFSEYFPFFNAFFSELGFEVVTSESNQRVAQSGINAVASEPCYPIKIAHGHVADVLEKGVDYLFIPAILQTEQPNPNYRQSQTCPYLQCAPEMLTEALGVAEKGVKCLKPRLFFFREVRHVRRVMREVARQLGFNSSQADKALLVANEALKSFRAARLERGREVYRSLGKEQVAFVVVGRPYALYDPLANMNIGRKIRDLGILPIPMDFLPLDEEDPSPNWPSLYSRQIQKKVAVASMVRNDPRLRAIVLTYFACGPDSFANPFFKDELAEPCYVMQIDEHTADAGVITRLEAFADTVNFRQPRAPAPLIKTNDMALTRLNGRRVWVPYACEAAHILAAVLRTYDFNAEVLPRSLDPGLNLARANISEDVCLPALMTTEDMLLRAQQPDFDPQQEAFFQGKSDGPCRFGMYHILQKRIFDKLGLTTVDLVTLGNIDHDGGLGTCFSLVAWDGFVAHDMLQKMLLHTRPYEIEPGESDAVFQRFLKEVCDYLPEHSALLESARGKWLISTKRHLEYFEDLLRRAQKSFQNLPKRTEGRPLVGLVGEFYVRLHDSSNQDVIRTLEKMGAEVWLAPLTEFFAYSNYITGRLAFDAWWDTLDSKHLKETLKRRFQHWLAIRDEHRLFEATLPYMEDFDDIPVQEVVRKGSLYVHPTFGGEAICSLGKAEDFAERCLAGVVSVVPFNCMPGMAVSALSYALRRRHNNIPFLSLDFDGFVDSSRQGRLASFMTQARERHRNGQGHQPSRPADSQRMKS
jgi:predicted CoA-substrate-specific enzyme activase